MRKPFGILLMSIVIVILSIVTVRAQDATAEATPDTNFGARTYELHVPDVYQDGQAVPLLMVLHGASGSGARTEKWLGFDDLADSENFIAVYPDGIYNNWDFGAGVPTPDGSAVHIDDVGYLVWLVADLEKTYSIDPARVFVTGNSNGALMAYRLACEARDTFQAVAGVAAGVFVPAVQKCQDRPISVLFMQGTEDNILPWDGTDINGRHLGLSAAESLAFWTQLNHCNTAKDAVKPENLPDTDSTDHSKVTRISITDCADGSQVQFYAIVGGGHTWPGRPFDVGFDLGAVNLDIDATQIIWDWFAELGTTSMPEATPTQ
ncbi:MAG: PHB depolymerase family esterase [Chloroflexota bacterium]